MPELESTGTDRIFVYFDATSVPPGPQPDLVFDDHSLGVWHLGGDGLDASGEGRHGTPSGTTVVPGRVGQALSFAGNGNSEVALPAAGGTTGTMSAWLRPAALTGPSGHPLVAVYGARDGDDGYGRHDETHLDLRDGAPNDNPGAYLRRCGDLRRGSAATVDAWIHLAATYEPSGTAALYVDGEQVGTSACDGSVQSFNQLYLGRVHATDLNAKRRSFIGVIDEVRLSSTPRSADWIKAEHRTATNGLFTAQPAQTRP